MKKYFNISEKKVFIIAELSANHNGSLDTAIKTIRAAKRTGADAIKLQTYTADTITINSNKKDFIIPANNPWEKSTNLYSLYKEAFTPWEWHEALYEEANKVGIDIFSSPFDQSAVELLESLDTKFYKIASPEIFDVGLIKSVAETQKPVLISTGLANKDDILLAIETLKQNGCNEIILLKCTTAYPAPFDEVNLKTMQNFEKEFNVLYGLSDHTLGIELPIAAVSLGASVIEKHFVIEGDQTVDSFFSLDTENFKEMIQKIRNVELSMGDINYKVTKEAEKNLWAKRSLYFIKNVKKGQKIKGSYKSIRPGYGLHPKHFDEIKEYVATRDIETGDRVDWDKITEDTS